MSKILTVFGVTGSQGGSVARAVLNHPQLSKEYSIRAVTRDITKPSAKALEQEGMNVVQADLNDQKSVLSAISGSYAVFGVTNFWEKADYDTDVAQGKHIANASKEAGVQHLIWSSLPNVTKMTSGKLNNAKAFDSKAAIEEYIRSLGIPSTFYMSGVYMSNLKLATRKTPNGYTIAWPIPPTTKVPLIDAVSDTGKWITTILSSPSQFLGKRINGTSGWITPEEFVVTISEVADIKVAFRQIPDELFKSFFPPEQGEMRLQALICLRDWGYYGADAKAEVEASLSVFQGKPTFFRDFVEMNLPWVSE